MYILSNVGTNKSNDATLVSASMNAREGLAAAGPGKLLAHARIEKLQPSHE